MTVFRTSPDYFCFFVKKVEKPSCFSRKKILFLQKAERLTEVLQTIEKQFVVIVGNDYASVSAEKTEYLLNTQNLWKNASTAH